MITELRPYQVEALATLRNTIGGNNERRICLQSPTGSGKTALAAAIVEGALSKGKRLTFCVPAKSLIDQTMLMFYREGIRGIGVIQAKHPLTDPSQPVQIASAQTLCRRQFPETDVVIIDECHQWFDIYGKWLHDPAMAHVPFIGLSATPWRKGLGEHLTTLKTVATTRDLIDQGYLCKFRVFATGHPDLAGVKIVAGDYKEDQLSEAMQKGTLTADIVDTWVKKWGKDKTVCYGVDCAHAQALQERFQQAGIKCAYQDARTSLADREEIKRAFHNGDVQIISNVATLTTGIDYDVRCIILARPTRSEMLFVQIIGRGLRNAPGKDDVLILDHSDTTQRLGFVTDIHHDRLDDGKEEAKSKPKPPLPKECPSCHVLKPPRTPVCPNCGFKPDPVSGTFEVDGELVELTDLTKVRRKIKEPGHHVWTREEKKQFYRELLAYARDHGRKEGWAFFSYREKFSEKPPWSWRDEGPAAYPSILVTQWVRSRNIAYARTKGAMKTVEPYRPGAGTIIEATAGGET